MPTCPICSQPLATVRQREGVFYPCPACSGRAATISQVRHVLGDLIASKLLRLLKLSNRKSQRACPFCAKPMFSLRTEEPPLELEGCRGCSVVWFDGPTYESIPQRTVETTNSIPLLANEILALDRLKKFQEQEKEREQGKKKKPLHRSTEEDRNR